MVSSKVKYKGEPLKILTPHANKQRERNGSGKRPATAREREGWDSIGRKKHSHRQHFHNRKSKEKKVNVFWFGLCVYFVVC